MSSRNRGQKTLTAEDTIDADLVNTIALEADGQAGEANQFLKKDANNKLVYENLVVPDNSIDGDKLTSDITITTTGDITAHEIKTGIISNNNSTILIEETISLDADKNINLQGTGGISIPVGSISLSSGNITTTNGSIETTNGLIKATGGAVLTTKLDTPTSGQNLLTLCNLVLDADKAVHTTKLDTPTTGQNLATKCNLVLDADKNITLQGTGGITTGTTGLDVPIPGSISVDTINAHGSNTMVVGSSVSLNQGKSLFCDAVQFDSLTKRNGTGAISVSNDLTLAADKSISLSGTGSITNTSGNIICGAGNIQAGTGEVHTDTIDNSAGNGGTIACKGNLQLASKSITTSGTGGTGTFGGNLGTAGNLSATGNIQTDAYLFTDNIQQRTNNGNTTIHNRTIIGSVLEVDQIQSLSSGGQGYITIDNNVFLGGGQVGEHNLTANGLELSSDADIRNLYINPTQGQTIVIVQMTGLPTSATNLLTGQLYNDSGTLKIA